MQNLNYGTLGFTHRKTPIEIREKLAFSNEREILGFLRAILREFKEIIPEILLISTCNRTEFFFTYTDFDKACKILLDCVCNIKGLDLSFLKNSVEAYSSTEAVHHIFGVASSLDSAVVGETQISGQLKDAYRLAYSNDLCSKEITRIMHFAFKIAARVRNQTQISSNAVSVASITAQKSQSLQQQHHLPKKALVVGFGEMGRLVSKHLLSHGFEICIVLRNEKKIEEAKNLFMDWSNFSVEVFSKIVSLLPEYPIVISATGALNFVIRDELLVECKKDSKRFYFDLALPRDVDLSEKLREDLDIEVFCIDDLKGVADSNLIQRRESLTKAYQIVGMATMEFVNWRATLGVEPLIKSIRELAKTASLREVDRAVKKGYIPRDLRFNVEKILHQAFNTFLHKPTQNLRNYSSRQDSDVIIESIKTFFGQEGMLAHTYKCEYDDIKE